MSTETERHLFNFKKNRETAVWRPGFKVKHNFRGRREGLDWTHPQPNSSLVLEHRHLQVDGWLRPGLAGETDVEGVVAELIPSQALVGPVVTVEHGLDGQSGLPSAVADLEMVILMIYKQQIFQLLWLLVSSQKYHFKVDHLS